MATDQLRTTLKVHRAMHDLTQADLAERVGITRKSLNLPSLKEGDSHGLRRKISASTPA